MFDKSKWARLGVTAGAALALCSVISMPSQAGLVLTLDDLSTVGVDVIVVDNAGIGTATAKGPSTGSDSSGTAGLVQFVGSVGSFVVTIGTGSSKPVIGGIGNPMLDLNGVAISGQMGGTLEIMLTDTDYVLPPSDHWKLFHTIGGTTNGTVLADGFADPANGEFVAALTAGTLGSFGPGAFSGSTGAKFPGSPGDLSLSQTVRITHSAGSQITSFDSSVYATVPEPGTLALFGLGLAGLGFARRRKTL